MTYSVEINTSTIAKLYRTTTADIEKRLRSMGLTPIRTVQMQSGRRFLVWDKDRAVAAMDGYKAKRLATLQEREELRKELMSKQSTVPRTSYDSPDIPGATPTPVDAQAKMDLILQEIRRLHQEIADLKSKVDA